jgi:GTP-binding protein
VVFVVKDNLRTLVHLKRVRSYRAENGRDGQGRRNFGRKGADIEIPVPPGTVIKDATTGEIIKDLEGLERYVFLKGGNGGRGNWHFRSPTRQAPRYAQQGEKGVAMRIGVELLIIADIGFVGFPNAGKSSLLNNLTNARTKVAGYPFTTKIPQLGMFRYGNNDIVLADIPGIIEGASQGAGMGLKFLRHISRTVALAFLIDLGDERYATTLETLQGEIGEYAPELLEKPYVVIGTKIDLEGARERLAELQTKHPTIGLSNTSTEGLEEVKQAFIKLVDVEGREVDDGFTTSVDLDAHYREEP